MRLEAAPQLPVHAATGLGRVAGVGEQSRVVLPVGGEWILAIQPGDHRGAQTHDEEEQHHGAGGHTDRVTPEAPPAQLTRRTAGWGLHLGHQRGRTLGTERAWAGGAGMECHCSCCPPVPVARLPPRVTCSSWSVTLCRAAEEPLT